MTHAIFFGLGVSLTIILSGLYRNWLAGRVEPGPVECVGPPKVITAIPIIVGSFFAGRALWGIVTEGVAQWILIFVFGAALIVPFLPMLFRSDVFVRDGQVSGPASLVGPFTWYKRTTFQLSDVSTVGNAPYDYSYVESTDGRRIYIHNSYRGANGLIAGLDVSRADRAT